MEEIRNQPTVREIIITRKSQRKDIPTKIQLRVENTGEKGHRKLSTKEMEEMEDNKGISLERLQDGNGEYCE